MKRLFFCLFMLTTTSALADLNSDMINDRLDRLDREMTLLQKKVYATSKDPNTPLQGNVAPAENLGEVYTQLDEQAKTIAELTRKVEELTHAQDVLRSDFQNLRADTDIRFPDRIKSINSSTLSNSS